MGHFGTEVYFIFIRGASGPLCKWLRERMGNFSAGVYFMKCATKYIQTHTKINLG